MRAVWLLVLLLLGACTEQAATDKPRAERVFVNAEIHTVDPAMPRAEAMVVADGRFVFVGSSAKALEFATADTEVVDLGGRLVIPGIVDAHTHPGQIDLLQYDASVYATERADFLSGLGDVARSSTGEGWLRICCWPVIAFVDGDRGPDRRELDALFPDRPVWVTSNAGHSFWLNSLALERLGIDAASADPAFPVAVYHRDADGRLTGWLKEGAGWQLMDEVFEIDREAHEAGMRAMLRTLSTFGVTTLYDAGTKEWSDRVYGFLAGLEAAGELPLRYEGTYRISSPDRLETAIAEMRRFRSEYGGARLQFNTIKLFMDGVHENRSGALLEPYADMPGSIGDTLVSTTELRDFLLRLHAERFDLHVHAIGDLAVRRVLDAVEAAQAAVVDFYPRVSLGHLQTTHPDDWPRFAKLGVTANFTPWWHGPDRPDPVATGLGEKRASDTYRAQALMDAGANVTFSSDDWTLPVLSPFLGMQVGHTRQYPREWLAAGDDPEQIREPAAERMPIDRLIRGYTLNGAYQLRMETRIGSIVAGKSADFVVLDDDLFTMDPYALHTVRPAAVSIDGQLRCQSPQFTACPVSSPDPDRRR